MKRVLIVWLVARISLASDCDPCWAVSDVDTSLNLTSNYRTTKTTTHITGDNYFSCNNHSLSKLWHTLTLDHICKLQNCKVYRQLQIMIVIMDARSAKAGVHVIFCQCFFFIYFFNGGSRKFYTWWTLSVIREVTTWIISWSSLNYRVGQKVMKFGVFSDPTRKFSALTPKCGRIYCNSEKTC